MNRSTIREIAGLLIKYLIEKNVGGSAILKRLLFCTSYYFVLKVRA